MANVKFTEFPSATTVGSTDIIPIVQGGTNKKATAAVFSTYIGSAFVALTGNQTIAGVKTFSSQLASSVATGTAPFSIASTTKVTNLNADLLDGYTSSDFQLALTNPITGTGTTNYLPKFTGTSALGNSIISDNGSIVSIGGALTTTGNIQISRNTESTFLRNTNSSGDFFLGIDSSTGSTFGNGNYSRVIYSAGAYPLDFWTNDLVRMRITSAGDVGIGTSSPLNFSGYKTLTINGTSGGLLYTQVNGTNAAFISAESTFSVIGESRNSNLWFATNGSIKGGFFANGNYAIGTTTDAGYKLDVNGTARFGGDVILTKSGTSTLTIKGNAITGFDLQNDTSGVYLWNRDATPIYFGTNSTQRLIISASGAATFSSSVTANGTLTVNEDGASTKVITIRSNWAGVDPAINVTTNNSLLLMTNNTERMRITSAGNVGIGTTYSGRKLNIGGSAYVDMVLKSTSASGVTGGGTLYFGNSADDIAYVNYDHASNFMSFATNNSERMRITSSGDLLVGTSSSIWGTSNRGIIQVNGTSQALIGLSVGGADKAYLFHQGTNLSVWNVANGYMEFGTNNTTRLFITSGGNVLIGTTTDAGYKLDVNGTARVQSELRVKSSNYTATYNTSLRSNSSAAGILQLGNNNDNYILAGNTGTGGYLIFRVNCTTESITSGIEALRIAYTGEVGIGTSANDPSAKMQIDSTTQGFLVPRMTEAEINSISSPAEGLLVYNTSQHHMCMFDGSVWKKFSMSNM